MAQGVSPLALIGAPILVLVAQPWDFFSPAGRGRLRARIAGLGPGSRGHELRLDLTQGPVETARGEVAGLRATPLHPQEAELAAMLLQRRPVAARLYAPGLAGPPLLVGALRRL